MWKCLFSLAYFVCHPNLLPRFLLNSFLSSLLLYSLPFPLTFTISLMLIIFVFLLSQSLIIDSFLILMCLSVFPLSSYFPLSLSLRQVELSRVSGVECKGIKVDHPDETRRNRRRRLCEKRQWNIFSPLWCFFFKGWYHSRLTILPIF